MISVRIVGIVALLVVTSATAAHAAVTQYVPPTADSNPLSVATGTDGGIWFTEFAPNANRIGRVDPATGAIAEFPVPTQGGRPIDIAPGPDNAMWFTEAPPSGAGMIARIALDTHAITEFSYSGGNPAGVAPGPGGAMWFAQFFDDKLGTITTDAAHSTQSYSGLTPGSQPRDVAQGPDGAMWFTESNASRIGRITTDASHTVNEFSIPGRALGLAAGPPGDQHVWFADNQAGTIGAISTDSAHTVSEFHLPAGAAPSQLVAGPDGAMWFTDRGRAMIGRISADSSHTVTEYAAPADTSIEDITVGPAPGDPTGAFWITEEGHPAGTDANGEAIYTGGKLARFIADALPPPVLGTVVDASTDTGTVLVKLPAGAAGAAAGAWSRAAASGFVPLGSLGRQIPVGSTVDTTHGTVHLVAAATAPGATQDGHFSKGVFVVQQGRLNALTTVSMTGGALNSCSRLPHGGASKTGSAAQRRGRSLFSNVHGHFRTRGRNSDATTRGTEYLVKDTCQGTLTSVRRGILTVRDYTLRKNVTLKAGHRYLARAPRTRAR